MTYQASDNGKGWTELTESEAMALIKATYGTNVQAIVAMLKRGQEIKMADGSMMRIAAEDQSDTVQRRLV